MSETPRDLNLSKLEGAPTERAKVQLQLDSCALEEILAGRAYVKVNDTTPASSPQAEAHTTLI